MTCFICLENINTVSICDTCNTQAHSKCFKLFSDSKHKDIVVSLLEKKGDSFFHANRNSDIIVGFEFSVYVEDKIPCPVCKRKIPHSLKITRSQTNKQNLVCVNYTTDFYRRVFINILSWNESYTRKFKLSKNLTISLLKYLKKNKYILMKSRKCKRKLHIYMSELVFYYPTIEEGNINMLYFSLFD